MANFRQGDIFEASTEALVNTVNTVGVMGKGVALQFKRAFPDNYKAYAKACKNGEVKTGKIFVYDRNSFENPRFIFNFPTKNDWREKSKLEYIRSGLDDLVLQIERYGVKSIALPPLGCGNGGLDWETVRSLIQETAKRLPEVAFIVYEPQAATEPKSLAVNKPAPELTLVRATLLKMFASYEAIDESIGRLEAQKIAYFLQIAGIKFPRVIFDKGHYGPYAEVMNHMLQDLEGYYLEGYGDLSTKSRIRIKPEAVESADAFLQDYPEIQTKIQFTRKLISGFESPYGMELLATVHWVVSQEDASGIDSVVQAVQHWSQRKKYTLDEKHIRIAWKYLLDEGWLTNEALVTQ